MEGRSNTSQRLEGMDKKVKNASQNGFVESGIKTFETRWEERVNGVLLGVMARHPMNHVARVTRPDTLGVMIQSNRNLLGRNGIGIVLMMRP
jgi:hypothetical protein